MIAPVTAMRLLAAFSLLCSSTSFLFAQVPQLPPASSAEAAIRNLVQRYVNAREHQSATEVETLFTSDADQLVSSGEWRKGRAALVKGALASSQATGGTRSIEVTSVRFLTSDVAIADGRYILSNMKNGSTRKMWTSLILKRESGTWRIAAIRNMLPAPPAAPQQPLSEFNSPGSLTGAGP